MPEINKSSPPDAKKKYDKPYIPPPRRYFGQITVTLNEELYTKIDNLAKERHKSRSAIGQMLLNMGYNDYMTNQNAGIVTSSQAQQDKHRREAEGATTAAIREARKRGENVTPVTTAYLFGADIPDD